MEDTILLMKNAHHPITKGMVVYDARISPTLAFLMKETFSKKAGRSPACKAGLLQAA